jgi:hypothetical protein
MRWPPYLMQLKIRTQRHGFSLWLPLFIIGPIALLFLLALCLIALPFLLLSLLFTWRWYWLDYAVIGVPTFLVMLHSLRGLKIDVEDEDQHVVLAFY